MDDGSGGSVVKNRERRISWPVIVLSILEATYQKLAGENKKLARN